MKEFERIERSCNYIYIFFVETKRVLNLRCEQVSARSCPREKRSGKKIMRLGRFQSVEVPLGRGEEDCVILKRSGMGGFLGWENLEEPSRRSRNSYVTLS